ncbi:MAG TPA: sulfotransferase [Solirubrobacteraceae bacterium]|nr:sulfotransferase [Solirubrobacteraceae bacterium]
MASANARVPDFFIVGHPKCGTTAMYMMLRGHPQIFMPDNKEPRYFATDLRSRYYEQRMGSGQHFLHTLDGYLELFAPARADQRAGEASATYLISRAAAGAIAEVQPDARVIAILREPASFLRTFHLQMISSGVETERDFGRALALEEHRRRGERVPEGAHRPEMLLYSDHVRYTEQLRRYHDAFAREQVLVLVFEEFKRDNDGTLAQVLRFLDVDDSYRPEAEVETPSVAAVRFAPLHAATNRLRAARAAPTAAGPLARGANALLSGPLRNGPLGSAWRRLVYTERGEVDERLMAELRVRFKPEVEALGEYLGRDMVSLWRYDEL